MHTEVSDFLVYCRLERRLAPLTCSAYERDVNACIAALRADGIEELRLVRPPDLRRFLAAEAERRPAIGSQSEQGERTIERLLSVSHTCRLQRRSLFAYLAEVLTARTRGDPIPLLI